MVQTALLQEAVRVQGGAQISVSAEKDWRASSTGGVHARLRLLPGWGRGFKCCFLLLFYFFQTCLEDGERERGTGLV